MISPSAKIHPTAIIEAEVMIGERTAVWDNAHIRHNSEIGTDSIIGDKSYIAYGVQIGNLVKINTGVYICNGVTIQDGCLIAAHVVFANERYPRAANPNITELNDSDPTDKTLLTCVKRGVTIGTNATIGPGLTIGEFAMIGMGSVVTQDVPPHALVVGNPGKVVGLVARDGTAVWHTKDGEDMPSEGSRIKCPGDGHLVISEGKATHQA